MPTTIGPLVRLQVSKCAERGIAVAGVEQRSRDTAQVSRPHQVIDVIAVVVGLPPRRRGSGNESARMRLVLQAMQEGERRASQHPVIAADLAQGRRNLGLRPPRALERLAHGPCALLQGCACDLLGVGARVSETDRELKGAGANSDLGAG